MGVPILGLLDCVCVVFLFFSLPFPSSPSPAPPPQTKTSTGGTTKLSLCCGGWNHCWIATCLSRCVFVASKYPRWSNHGRWIPEKWRPWSRWRMGPSRGGSAALCCTGGGHHKRSESCDCCRCTVGSCVTRGGSPDAAPSRLGQQAAEDVDYHCHHNDLRNGKRRNHR